jgi:hypothetical protein
MKKKSRINALGLVIAPVAFVLHVLFSLVPFYPDFQRHVESFQEQKRQLSHSGFVLLDLDGSSDLDYGIMLSSRTLLAKAVGYLDSWHENIDGIPCQFYLVGSDEKINGDIVDAYQSIPILKHSGRQIGFALNGHSYVLEWYPIPETDIETTNQLTAKSGKMMIAYARRVIDASISNDVKGNETSLRLTSKK